MDVLAMVLAGGEGRRLRPLTTERAKPAVPFGGRYRIIDFVLSNLVNSGVKKIKVLTQYRSDSLLKHLMRAWSPYAGFGGYVEPVPPQMNVSKDWYLGSVDAVFQNLNLIEDEEPEYVAVFGADHVYKMNFEQMYDFHREKGAAATIAARPVPVAEARRFGCISVDENWRVTGFVEKPENPPEIPGKPGYSLASMGNYLFNRQLLIDECADDADRLDSSHDFGGDLLPNLYDRKPVFAYNFLDNNVPGEEERAQGYWVDIGTLESYHEASMDLVSVVPVLNLYNRQWPIHTAVSPTPPAKFVFADQQSRRIGIATDSMVSEGCVISGGHIEQCILGPNVRLNSFSHVSQSILFEGVEVGRQCRLRRTIVDKGVKIPEGTTIGYDPEEDAKRWFVSEDGIVVVPKGGSLSRTRTGTRDLPNITTEE